MFAMAAIPCVFHLIGGLITNIESPKWLLKNKGEEETRRMLEKLRGNKQIEKEIEELHEENKKTSLETTKNSNFCNKKNAKPIIVGMVLNFMQQATGFNAILYFLPYYMSNAGLSSHMVPVATIIFGVVNTLMTFVSAIMIDRLGRRFLLIFGMFGIFVCLAFISLFFFLNVHDVLSPHITGWTILLFTIVFVAFYAISIGPIGKIFLTI